MAFLHKRALWYSSSRDMRSFGAFPARRSRGRGAMAPTKYDEKAVTTRTPCTNAGIQAWCSCLGIPPVIPSYGTFKAIVRIRSVSRPHRKTLRRCAVTAQQHTQRRTEGPQRGQLGLVACDTATDRPGQGLRAAAQDVRLACECFAWYA